MWDHKLAQITSHMTSVSFVITSFAANGTMTMKTLNTFSTWGSHSLAAGSTGIYTVETTETQRVDSTWLQQ